MALLSEETLRTYGQCFAFLGNTLLKPMTQTSSIGLDPSFWEDFPCFGSDEVKKAIDDCLAYAHCAVGDHSDADGAVLDVSVEYTHLFVGPPSPVAPPWETLHRSADASVGFGEATFEMRHLLRKAELRLCGESNQYEDHMGIELLYLSVLCQRAAERMAVGGVDAGTDEMGAIRAFIEQHPLSWVDSLISQVEKVRPEGYFVNALRLTKALLQVVRFEASSSL